MTGDEDAEEDTELVHRKYVRKETTISQGNQVDTETQATQGNIDKQSTRAGGSVGVGSTSGLPTVTGKGSVEQQNSTATTTSTSDINRVSETRSIQETFSFEPVDDPDEADVSGTLDPESPNYIGKKEMDFINRRTMSAGQQTNSRNLNNIQSEEQRGLTSRESEASTGISNRIRNGIGRVRDGISSVRETVDSIGSDSEPVDTPADNRLDIQSEDEFVWGETEEPTDPSPGESAETDRPPDAIESGNIPLSELNHEVSSPSIDSMNVEQEEEKEFEFG